MSLPDRSIMKRPWVARMWLRSDCDQTPGCDIVCRRSDPPRSITRAGLRGVAVEGEGTVKRLVGGGRGESGG